VQIGQRVAAGAVLGSVGPGGLEGPGLYFEMRFQGRPEDPVDWLAARAAR
jgi:murein hydrolase activator